MASLPSPLFIDIPGAANFRDIGNGGFVREGLVYRSADPSKATAQGLTRMGRDLGIQKIFDFRSQQEIKRDGPEWAGVQVEAEDPFEDYGIKRQWVPVFASSDYGPEQIALRYKQYAGTGSAGFVQAYRDILHAAPLAYGAVFRHLAQPNPSPCLVHCTAGKDRTGVLVALLYMLVGAPDEHIASEYSLTDQGLAHLKPLFTERLLKNPALAGNPDGVARMISSKAENMTATLEMIRQDFAGPEAYMKKYCEMSDVEIQQLCANLKPS